MDGAYCGSAAKAKFYRRRRRRMKRKSGNIDDFAAAGASNQTAIGAVVRLSDERRVVWSGWCV